MGYKNDDLGTRMKEFYEQIPKFKLYRRTPVAIRIDGKAFHTFTRGFQKPFDEVLGNAMVETMKYLCTNIQGCVFGYCQSDEITLILVDYQTHETSAWFDYEIQKLCSVSASMATMAFNKFFYEEAHKVRPDGVRLPDPQEADYKTILYAAAEKGAMFDARCFNIPREEVCNLIYWRQLDATRNSIQMVGQHYFSHSELQCKSCNMIQDMLHEQKGINWNNYPTRWKRGVACYRVKDLDEYGNNWGDYWAIDYEMPILKGEDRAYVDNLIFVGE